MTDFTAARRNMVDGQIRTADVTDLRLIGAMLDLPRERFVPPEMAALAYLDVDLACGEGARMLKPMVLAKLVQAAQVGAGDRVLDVGCAMGYSAALLSALGADVVALEQDAAAARRASENLRSVVFGKVPVKAVTGPLASGWPQAGPYDAIVLNGATEIVPSTLLEQLKDGGRLVCILGAAPAGKATLYLRNGAEVGSRPLFDASAPLLPGFAQQPAFVF